MRYIGMNAMRTMAGALTPDSNAPTLESSPSAPPLRPLLSTVVAEDSLPGSAAISPLLMASPLLHARSQRLRDYGFRRKSAWQPRHYFQIGNHSADSVDSANELS